MIVEHTANGVLYIGTLEEITKLKTASSGYILPIPIPNPSAE